MGGSEVGIQGSGVRGQGSGSVGHLVGLSALFGLLTLLGPLGVGVDRRLVRVRDGVGGWGWRGLGWGCGVKARARVRARARGRVRVGVH